MGVSLLLSQERWQTFVSFGFDHIISGVCYLIRQKFKLTSFSLACFWVSCTVWSGFGSFSVEEGEGNSVWELQGERGRAIYLCPLGLHLLPRKDPPWDPVTRAELCGGQAQAQVGGSPSVVNRSREENGEVSSRSLLCSSPARSLRGGRTLCLPEQKPLLRALL